jgi:hypothetical protein
MILTLMLITANTSSAQQRTYRQSGDFDLAGRFGAGFQINVLNLGVGPCAEYWMRDNLGIMAAVGMLFDFTSISVRGTYLLDHTFDIFGYPACPYLGAGFASVKGPDYDLGGGSKVEQEGSGMEIYTGLLHPASYITKNLYLRWELILSTFELETTGTTSYGETITTEQDWGLFSFGAGITYYF